MISIFYLDKAYLLAKIIKKEINYSYISQLKQYKEQLQFNFKR